MNFAQKAASTIEEFSDGQKRKISHLLEEEDEMSPANEEPTKMQKTSHTFYIKLADESLHEEENQGGLSSDDATYDSTYHDRETDVCVDSSDEYQEDSTDVDTEDVSSSSSSIGHFEVLEYDIASTTDEDEKWDNDSLCTESSATVADDFYLAAALTEIAAQALRGSDDSSFSESEFAIFADTEWESDAPDGDPELTRHDYWKCIKCKNNQNNPMYRYCERCYQVRKSHFPPRPKKKRNRVRKRSSLSISAAAVTAASKSDESDTCEGLSSSINGKNQSIFVNDKPKNNASSSTETLNTIVGTSRKRKQKYDKKGENSAGEESISSSDSDNAATVTDRVSPNNNNKKRKNITSSSSSLTLNSTSTNQISCSSSSIENLSLPKLLTLQLNSQQSLKDSGFSESTGGSSSQESYSPCYERDILLGYKGVDTQSFSDEDNNKKSLPAVVSALKPIKSDSSISSVSQVSSLAYTNDDSELCSICKVSQKGAVFVHTNKACSGCCYTCALKTWKMYKNCPFCKAKPKNVMKLFTH